MAELPTEIEGPIESIGASGDGFEMIVLGQRIVYVPGPGKSLSTPAGELTVQQILDSTPLPSRTVSGFICGIATVEGEYDTLSGIVDAVSIAVEPAGNVIVGVVTQNNSGPPRELRVNGTLLRFLSDARMPSARPKNEFGFDIKIESIAENLTASAKGYYACNVFHVFLLEVGGGELVSKEPQVSILRAQSRGRGAENDVDVRGAITTSHVAGGTVQRVEVFRADPDPNNPGQMMENRLGGAKVRADEGGFARWRFDERITAGSGVLAEPPTLIRAYNASVPNVVSEDFPADVRTE